eukprot:CAMPEP_0202959390 /NCGR_PEP_ID=MMETSP1396-20130829/3578_1 /ASSEMBLY_ACC=CAM_ASM_000872 /TAXON_ID= /ORGANISM="Pseudokeronopsis sp., Strain Brazil" /LENGTH=96 /DNA_ID=CAMNT_0049677921 /DNA_START=728 /DNA_END=1018 /DNA_ORIENTATION=-
MVNGIGKVSDNMDYSEVSGANSIKNQRKPTANPKDTKSRCDTIFSLLMSHPGASLFTEALDPRNPHFEELRKDFVNLNLLQNLYKQGKFKNTFDLG